MLYGPNNSSISNENNVLLKSSSLMLFFYTFRSNEEILRHIDPRPRDNVRFILFLALTLCLCFRVWLSVQHPHHPGEKRGGRGDDVHLKFWLRGGRGERQLHREDKPNVPYEVGSKWVFWYTIPTYRALQEWETSEQFLFSGSDIISVNTPLVDFEAFIDRWQSETTEAARDINPLAKPLHAAKADWALSLNLSSLYDTVLQTSAIEVEKDFQNYLAKTLILISVRKSLGHCSWTLKRHQKTLSFRLSSGSLSNVVKHIELTSLGYFVARWGMLSHQTENLMCSSPLQALVSNYSNSNFPVKWIIL